MSKKDYEQLAAALRKSRPTKTNGLLYVQWSTDLQVIVGALKVDNPRFDADRFYRAASQEERIES